MIEAKADLSIKCSELPIVKSEGKKSVALTFKTGIGTVICNVKSKTYRKAIQVSEGFENWVAAISGKDLSVEGGVITMGGCGIQVFEKKLKAPKEEKAEVTAKPVQDKQVEHLVAEPELNPKRRVYIPNPPIPSSSDSLRD